MRYKKIITNNIFKFHLQIINELEIERFFCKHDINHLINVARIAYIYTLENKITIDKDLIYACALLHDIGRAEQYLTDINHNIAGAIVANSILEQCAYSKNEIELITEAIYNHSSSHHIHNSLSYIIHIADKLSRLCFECESRQMCKWEENKKTKELHV